MDDPTKQMSDEEYKARWRERGPIEIRMVAKNGQCRHTMGDRFLYSTPYERPAGVCHALLHVLELYVWRVFLGFPSWNEHDRDTYRIHCPDATGTVWEMRMAPDGHAAKVDQGEPS